MESKNLEQVYTFKHAEATWTTNPELNLVEKEAYNVIPRYSRRLINIFQALERT